MAKDKTAKAKGIPNKHLHARTTFLYQAATYLTLQASTRAPEAVTPTGFAEPPSHVDPPTPCIRSSLALQLGSHLHTVSRKGQVRLSIDVKRAMCKSCDTVLVPGRTCTQAVENESRGGKKPWADIMVVECLVCGGRKRFPVGAKRQESKSKRKPKDSLASKDSEGSVNPTTWSLQSGTDQSSTSRMPTPQP